MVGRDLNRHTKMGQYRELRTDEIGRWIRLEKVRPGEQTGEGWSKRKYRERAMEHRCSWGRKEGTNEKLILGRNLYDSRARLGRDYYGANEESTLKDEYSTHESRAEDDRGENRRGSREMKQKRRK